MLPQVYSHRVKLIESNTIVELLLVDAPSHPLAEPLAQKAVAECKFLMLVVDGRDRDMKQSVKKCFNWFKDATTIDKPKGVLVQNFCFEGGDPLNQEQLDNLADGYGLKGVRTNVQQGKYIDDAFMALAKVV